MADEDRWAVPLGRRGSLTGHNVRIRNDGHDDAILYYPGSGADILHALFGAGARTRYFVFVDPTDLDEILPGHIRETHSRLNTTEARPILDNLRIRSQPAGSWMFSFQGRSRYLFHFRTGHDAFVAANRGFFCDIVFEKDFWESEDVVDLSSVLTILRVGGHYSTNSSLGLLSAVLQLVGLDFVSSYQINGDQFLFKRRTVTNLAWANLRTALTESLAVIQDLIMADEGESALSYEGPFDQNAIRLELVANQAAMLLPFTNRGVNVPVGRRNPLCRQIAIKAAGGAVFNYVSGIDLAFP